MGYVIAAILVVLIVGAGITFFVSGAARRSNVSDAEDPRAIAAPDDESPVGSTSQHAESDEGGAEPELEDGAHAAPPVDGGEGEGRRAV